MSSGENLTPTIGSIFNLATLGRPRGFGGLGIDEDIKLLNT
jgi:hypothetical protein